MCDISKSHDNPNVKGLAFLTHPSVKYNVTDFKT